jgi:hypothetical protein
LSLIGFQINNAQQRDTPVGPPCQNGTNGIPSQIGRNDTDGNPGTNGIPGTYGAPGAHIRWNYMQMIQR